MTDRELADELRATFTNATGPTTTDDWCKVARRARELLAKTVATWEAVDEWAKRDMPMGATKADIAWYALAHFAAPAAPINGMTAMEIQAAMESKIESVWRGRTDYRSLPSAEVVALCASVARSLAQPAPVEDPDKAAKALAFIHWSQRSDSRQMMDNKTEEALWEILSSDERNGWRAVAAAMKKGVGDE